MSGTRTTQKRKKAAKRARKKPEPIKKRRASVVEMHSLPGRMILCALVGKLGHPARALAQFDDIKLVGALEDAGDMRDIVLQTGAAVLAALTSYPIGKEGSTIRGLIQALVDFHGIDVEAIKAEIAKEAEEEAKAELEQAEALAMEKNPEHFEEEATIAQVMAGPTEEIE